MNNQAEKKIKYLTRDQVMRLHDRILDLTGGDRGILLPGNLDFTLDQVRSIGEGLPSWESLVKKAAFLLYNLTFQYPFVYGNKGTAFGTMQEFLQANNYKVQANATASYNLMLTIASGRMSLNKLEKWIGINLANIS